MSVIDYVAFSGLLTYVNLPACLRTCNWPRDQFLKTSSINRHVRSTFIIENILHIVQMCYHHVFPPSYVELAYLRYWHITLTVGLSSGLLDIIIETICSSCSNSIRHIGSEDIRIVVRLNQRS